MRGNHLTTLAGVAAVALLLTSSAEAKFSISLTLEPARPIARKPVRMIVRTGVVLPRKHDMRLTAVGPWRETLGQTFFDVRLVRIGPRGFKATVRFPYPGRWRLIVPNAPEFGDRPVRVRPQR